MADSYHIIDGQVIPYSGGRKCSDTDVWRDATPLELQLQEQLEEYECTIAAQEVEIEALRAEVGELHMHAKRRDQYALEKAAQALDWKKRAERLEEALRKIAALTEEFDDLDDAVGIANEALERENDDA